MNIKKLILIAVGCISLVLGSIGIALPILPTVPFYLLSAFCFANSSQKLHDWFVSTRVYKDNLQSYAEKRGMTSKTKISVLASVTVLMGFGFFMMKNVLVGRIVLFIVWVCHIIYFVFGVKTVSSKGHSAEETEKE